MLRFTISYSARSILLLATIALYAGSIRAQAPSGSRGNYSGTYIGGNSGGYHAGDAGVYQGGHSGGYHKGYNDIYLGGYPEVSSAITEPRGNGTRGDSLLRLPESVHSAPRIATLIFQVPGDADIWVDGQKTTMTGRTRVFISPLLMPATTYSYLFRVHWKENGRDITQTRKVIVHAGDRLIVDFITPLEKTPRRP